jgi:hypothetical protein
MQTINKDQIKDFIKESVEWLQKEQEGCCRYKLDDHLAIFVGWSGGYGEEERNDVIQAKNNPDWGINAGIKVWTSDYMQTDFDWLNFPYEKDGDVWDMSLSIAPNDNYNRIVKSLLEWYNEVSSFTLADDGKILRKTMWVCEHCLWGIESHEGRQLTLAHYIDEEDDCESKCDFCEETGFDLLYEIF